MTHIHDSWKELILGGVEIPLTGPLPDNNLAVFQRRITIGDASLDSNPLMSAWVISDLSGGHGVDDLNESTDTTRYKSGTFYTRYPKKISKQYKINEVTKDAAWAASGTPRVMGDVFAAGSWQTIMVLDNKVYSLTTPGTLIGTMTVNPQQNAVLYKGKLCIPMGTSGYAYVDSTPALTNKASSGTSPAVMAFVTLEDKLVAIDTVGLLWWTTDVTSTWTSYGITVPPTGGTDRDMVSYFDRNGQPAIFIMTDTEVLQFDSSGPNFFSVDAWFPFHPDNVIGMEKWNGDLYFQVYQAVQRYTGGSVSGVGLDRDSGLPAEYAGPIYDMRAGVNSLFATVTKPDLSSFTFPGGAPTSMNSLHEYTGFGWHMIWESSSENLNRYGTHISRGGGNYRLYWCSGGNANYAIYYIDLPRRFANPRERARAEGGFHTNGYLETSLFDAGMRGYTKIAASLDVNIEAMGASAVLSVYYRTEVDAVWALLGLVTETGSTHLQFGTVDEAGIHPGIPFEKIQLKFILADSTNEAFIMESAVLAFVKTLAPSNSYTAQVDLSKTHAGRSPDEILQYINSLMDARVFTSMTYRGVTRRVMISQHSGTSETGDDERSFRTLSLLEIPDGLDIL